jgi:small subunit ribosomal protein S17
MSEQQQATSPAGAQRTLTGTVVSNKMQKTVAVTIERLVKHERYGKYVRRTTKVLAHDEASECKEGDVVDIAECRRLSARKAWKVVRVVKRAGAV